MKIEIHKSDEKGDFITVKEELAVTWNSKSFTIPEGFESDGVSTPRCCYATISPAVDPRTLRAGLAHDYIYRVQPPDWTRVEADQMFYDFCREDGLGWWAAQKAYWGLRLFGGKAWKENQEALDHDDL